ncbi:uncharacterized protein EV420DRAFT_1488280 [Desarmillaria tabescens]|uniref:Uncharacterized protein n=1 Tax=Armillaria tabescens TaxID=1929756 RepID=A0AA39MHF6_ARMTA|nr:uncharacterized protein EV420DRAFT_1488280 [Desarmillaria tabescens]KAK0435001.1 hypothetical protein EV420DRAFT_1488280 [Desarmillaria tabescens]
MSLVTESEESVTVTMDLVGFKQIGTVVNSTREAHLSVLTDIVSVGRQTEGFVTEESRKLLPPYCPPEIMAKCAEWALLLSDENEGHSLATALTLLTSHRSFWPVSLRHIHNELHVTPFRFHNKAKLHFQVCPHDKAYVHHVILDKIEDETEQDFGPDLQPFIMGLSVGVPLEELVLVSFDLCDDDFISNVLPICSHFLRVELVDWQNMLLMVTCLSSDAFFEVLAPRLVKVSEIYFQLHEDCIENAECIISAASVTLKKLDVMMSFVSLAANKKGINLSNSYALQDLTVTESNQFANIFLSPASIFTTDELPQEDTENWKAISIHVAFYVWCRTDSDPVGPGEIQAMAMICEGLGESPQVTLYD